MVLQIGEKKPRPCPLFLVFRLLTGISRTLTDLSMGSVQLYDQSFLKSAHPTLMLGKSFHNLSMRR